MSIFRIFTFILLLPACSSFAISQKFDTRDVLIKSNAIPPIGSCSLGATITSPILNSKALVVLIHGSGAINKNGDMPGGFSSYRDIAEFLSSNGVTVIRFDKRSSIKDCAKNMNTPKFSYKFFVNDIINVVKYAQAQPKLANLPTILISHSQGVNFSSQIAAELKVELDGLVLIAGMGKYAIDETIIRQFEQHLKNPQLPVETRKQFEEHLKSGKIFFLKARNNNYNDQDFFMGAYAPFWSEYINFTRQASEIASRSNLPTLVLQCSKDVNVTREDFNALVQATKNNPGSDSAWIPNCHHFLAVHPETKVSQDVLLRILDWINLNF